MEYYNIYNADYTRLINDKHKISVTKVELLDNSEGIIGEIIDDFIVGSDNLTISYNQGVQGKLSFKIYNNGNKYSINEDSPFWFGRKFKYFKGLKDITNNNIYWFSKGIYTVLNVSQDDDIISVETVDKFGILSSEIGGACLETSTKIDLGNTVENMIKDMLTQPNGQLLPTDPIMPLIDIEIGKMELGEDIELSSGSYFGDVFIEIANSLRCRIYYDNEGHLIFNKGSTDFTFANKAPMWEFDEDFSNEFLGVSANYNYSDVKNRVTVWGEGLDGRTYVSTATNNNPKSPTRVSLVGYRVAKTIENMYGYNQSNVDAYAETYIKMKSILGMSVKVDCTMIPHLNVEDVVLLRYDKLNIQNQRFLISEISYSGEQMSISLCNVDSIPQCEEFQ